MMFELQMSKNIIFMTLKVEKPFDISQVALEKNMRLKTPMASTISSYCSYTKGIETNARKLK